MYTKAYKYGLKPCDLCVTEKYVTARADQENLPNKRTEIVSKYCHWNKYLIKKFLNDVVLNI